MPKFSLDFVQSGVNQYWFFPIPQPNIYQKIENLSIPQLAQISELDQDNQLLIVKADRRASMRFLYQAQAIKIDWANVRLKKSQKAGDFYRDQYVNAFDPKMQELATKWQNQENDPKKICEIFYEKTLEYLSYGRAIKGLHPYSQAFQERVTDCGGFATFLLTLLETQGIVGRLAVGYLLKNNYQQKIKNIFNLTYHWSDLTMHAWLELQTAGGSWIPLDPAVDWRYRNGQSQRFAAFANLPADRLLISYGHNHQLTYFDQEHYWPILQHPQLIKVKNA
jgi:hypothetical protein